jgi:hypothetical protein
MFFSLKMTKGISLPKYLIIYRNKSSQSRDSSIDPINFFYQSAYPQCVLLLKNSVVLKDIKNSLLIKQSIHAPPFQEHV